MKLVADLHIHSHYSRATSKDLTFEHLAKWAQLKGVHVVGTGDIAHPGWLEEMRDKLEPAEEGLYRLKDDIAAAVQRWVPPSCQGTVRFMLAGEISNIYKNKGATRKIHHVVFAPSLQAVEQIQARLERIGNIRSDGRPILGLPSRDLLEIILEVDQRCHLIPAHIWTPWFALLGSRSGYDSVEACFDDLTSHIFALETGLSSDPPMNWRVSALDRYTLVSNSDAHSPQKLAREATLFDSELSYDAIFQALQSGDPATFRGTIEFFPEEGKYHLDGHRKCGISWEPKTTLDHEGICPVCGKRVTVGVMHRVELLADRPEGQQPSRVHPFHSLIPLPEVLSELHGVGAGSKRVQREYQVLLERLGPELTILQDLPLEQVAAGGGERLAEGIGRMRRGQVTASGGYDGEYGVIKVFAGVAVDVPPAQIGLFADGDEQPEQGEEGSKPQETSGKGAHLPPETEIRERAAGFEAQANDQNDPTVQLSLLPSSVPAAKRDPLQPTDHHSQSAVDHSPFIPILHNLNPQQRAAVLTVDAPLVIVAGPGTGKTRTLTTRIAYLIQELGVDPEAVLAITFTNKAAQEMAERLADLLDPGTAARVTVKTFHGFGALVLRHHGGKIGLNRDFAILGEEERLALLQQACPELGQQDQKRLLAEISAAKAELWREGYPEDSLRDVYERYQAALEASQAVDFDDLILLTVRLLETCPDVLQVLKARFRWISVDEYQDINHAQYRLLRSLSKDANVCVIGDPDQAIYGFRGADRRYFLSFQQDYPGAKVLTLNQNYRSSPAILEAAMQVISQAQDKPSQRAIQGNQAWPLPAAQAIADFAQQVKLEVIQAPTDRAEAETVVHRIEQMVGGTSYFSLDSGRVAEEDSSAQRSFGDFAVLYRLGAQSRLLIEAFERSAMPFQTVGQGPLASDKAVREVLAYLWLVHKPASRVHLEKALAAAQIRLPGRIGQDLWELVGVQGISLAEAFTRVAALQGIATTQGQRLRVVAALWQRLQAPGQPVVRLVDQVQRFLTEQRARPPDGVNAERVRRLSLRATLYGDDLRAFLEAMALESETDAYDPRAGRVALMTLHAAKGLEFPVVFVVGCEEGLLPYMRPDESPDIEEERRLFYVGMTRARHNLILSSAKTRYLFGQRVQQRASRFVEDIESALKETRTTQRRAVPARPDGVQLSLL